MASSEIGDSSGLRGLRVSGCNTGTFLLWGVLSRSSPGESEGGDVVAKPGWIGIGLVVLGPLMASVGVPGPLMADETIRAKLQGFSEVSAVSTTGSGEFRGKISGDGDSIAYELTYDGIEGAILQAHIHLAQRSVNGGIVLFLCATNTTTPAPAPVGTAPCPANGGKVTGTLTANDIRPVLTQGIETGA